MAACGLSAEHLTVQKSPMSVDSVHSDTVHIPFLQSMQSWLWFIHILLPDCVIFS